MRIEIKFVGFHLVFWSCGQNGEKPLVNEGVFLKSWPDAYFDVVRDVVSLARTLVAVIASLWKGWRDFQAISARL